MHTLITGHVYKLSGMSKEMWQVPHPRFGTPYTINGIYQGTIVGTRAWYGFEIHVRGKEEGMIFMPEGDLVRLRIRDLGPFKSREA